MKKGKFVLVILFLLSSSIVAFAQSINCYQTIINGELTEICATDIEEPWPSYVPSYATRIESCPRASGQPISFCQYLYTWVIQTSPISPVSIPAEPKKISVQENLPSSGYVNGVWIPIYGLPCDQVYAMGQSNCMCFYNQEQWCN